MGDLDKATEQYWFNEVKRLRAVVLSYEEEAAIAANHKAQIEAAKSCQRYDQGEHRGYALGNALMEKCDDGDYVLFDDLEAALQQGE